MDGKVVAVSRSREKGTVKKVIDEGELVEGFGLKDDAHGGDWHRQISLLDESSINKMRGKGYELNYGDFAENITTEGMKLYDLAIGTRLKVGEKIILEVTQIGKKCHHDCEIAQTIGECVMPQEGIFAKVINGGVIKSGNPIEIIN